MKWFKNIDEKLAEVGFTKVEEDEFGAAYDRYNSTYNYTHRVRILHKYSGNHILQSYDPAETDERGNIAIGLTAYEMELFFKKMRKMGLYSRKHQMLWNENR